MSIFENIFRQTCFNHFFELKIAELHKAGHIKIPVYLSLGSEHIPPAVFEADNDYVIFPQHRCHSWFLSAGGDPKALLNELLGRVDGCNRGMGGSASVSIKGKMFGHDGLLGSQIIGIGYCHTSNKKTLIVCGDAAVEECYVLSSLGYAATNKLPVLIIVEDNGLSIKTPKKIRRSYSICDVAKGFGLNVKEISDDPLEIYEFVKKCTLPALLNINTCRHFWHAGSSRDAEPDWNTYELIKKRVGNSKEIEEDALKKTESLLRSLNEF